MTVATSSGNFLTAPEECQWKWSHCWSDSFSFSFFFLKDSFSMSSDPTFAYILLQRQSCLHIFVFFLFYLFWTILCGFTSQYTYRNVTWLCTSYVNPLEYAVFQYDVPGARDQHPGGCERTLQHSVVTTDNTSSKSKNGQVLLTHKVWFRILKSRSTAMVCLGFWADPF